MFFYLLVVFIICVTCWMLYIKLSRNPRDRIDTKELIKAWETKMPREIKEHDARDFELPLEYQEPTISDTSSIVVNKRTVVDQERISSFGNGVSQLKLFGTASKAKLLKTPIKSRYTPIERRPRQFAASLLKIYIHYPDNSTVNGGQLVSSLNKVGLTYGDMSIFHYFSEENEIETIFSAASMVEPGTFDLTKIQALKTPGVVLFVNPNLSVDTFKGFGLMLEKAKRLALLLKADLFRSPGVGWTEEYENEVLIELGAFNG